MSRRSRADLTLLATIARLQSELAASQDREMALTRDRDRLRENVNDLARRKMVTGAYRDEFKDRAEAAEAEVNRLREALEPFASFAKRIAEERPGWYHEAFVFNVFGDTEKIPFRWFIDAIRALANTQEGGDAGRALSEREGE